MMACMYAAVFSLHCWGFYFFVGLIWVRFVLLEFYTDVMFVCLCLRSYIQQAMHSTASYIQDILRVSPQEADNSASS